MGGAGEAGRDAGGEHSDIAVGSIGKVQAEAVGKVQIFFAGYNSKPVT
jgi:hypothetical protein